MLSTLIALAAIAQAPVGPPQVRTAVEKSLVFLEKGGLEWETKKCVSCHHGPWIMWSGYEAKKRGFAVNDKSLETVRAGAIKAYNAHPKLKPTNRDVLTDLTINVTYLTFGLGAAGEPDGEAAKFFDRAAAHLIEQQSADGSWKVIIKKTTKDGATTTFLMPPLIDQDDVTTMWALLTLMYREPSGISPEVLVQSQARGLNFLRDHPRSDVLQSLVLRILLSQRLDKSDQVQAYVRELLALQQDDGGWSQTKKLPTDALGTGQALVALSTGGVTATDPAITKAWAYLLKTQEPDGSWKVASRAYEPPEFSGYMGTAWATLAFVRTLPEGNAAETTSGPAVGTAPQTYKPAE